MYCIKKKRWMDGWRRSAYDPKHLSSSVKPNKVSVIVGVCVAAYEKGSPIFIDDLTHDGSSSMNLEVSENLPVYREMHPILFNDSA